MGGAEVQCDDTVSIAGEPEEGRLAETEGACIAPDKAKAQGHEDPGKEVSGIADCPTVREERIGGRCQHRQGKADPEARAAAERLGTVQEPQPMWQPAAGSFPYHCVPSCGCHHARSFNSQPDRPRGSTRITRITAIRRPICPASCPPQAVMKALIMERITAAGAVPRNTSAPPTTTVTKLSTRKVAPMVGTIVMVGA